MSTSLGTAVSEKWNFHFYPQWYRKEWSIHGARKAREESGHVTILSDRRTFLRTSKCRRKGNASSLAKRMSTKHLKWWNSQITRVLLREKSFMILALEYWKWQRHKSGTNLQKKKERNIKPSIVFPRINYVENLISCTIASTIVKSSNHSNHLFYLASVIARQI